jgi:site-specific DNA-cytosine methylase
MSYLSVRFKTAHLLIYRKVPRWIFLENVKGFQTSDMLVAWKTSLESCGYYWREYLVSPVTSVAIPNHRLRYYMIAEHRSSVSAKRLLGRLSAVSAPRPNAEYNDDSTATVEDLGSACSDGVIHTNLPAVLASHFPKHVETIGAVLAPVRGVLFPLSTEVTVNASNIMEKLYLPVSILTKAWAVSRLSIVGDDDQETYCFTKGYGKLYDKSTGSLYLENKSASDYAQLSCATVDTIAQFHGRIRMFHPNELLALAGFPLQFTFPADMVLHKQFACIGNSINVVVVRELMRCLFDPDVALD